MRASWVGTWVVCGAAVALAAESGGEQGVELVLRTQALEARRVGDWSAALRACQALRARGPLELSLELLVAEAHLALGEDARASEALERVLAQRPDHAHALYLSARVAVQTGDREGARARLILAARAGRPVLADAGSPAGSRLFGWLLHEPRTVLELMRAAQAFELRPVAVRRDPFAPPRRRDTGELVPPSAELQEVEREILAILRGLDRQLLLEEPDLHALLAQIDRLSALVERHAALPGADPAALRERLGEWALRNGTPGDLRQRVWLRLLLREGNRRLLAMRGDLDGERFAVVRAGLLELEELAARLRAVPGLEGERLAEALLVRARALGDEARDRERLARLPLRVTGLVVPPAESDEVATAIVDDRLVHAGETISLGEDEREGLTVVAIGRGGVRLRYRGIELVRGLAARSRD